MLLLIVNNCWDRSFALGYWFFISLVFLTQMRKKTFTVKRMSQVRMYVAFLPLPLLGTVIFLWQLVVLLCQTNLLLDLSWRGTQNKYLYCLCLLKRITSWGVHIMLFLESLQPALIVHDHTLAVSLVLIWSARFDVTGWYLHTFSVHQRFCCLFATWVARVLKVTVVPTDCPVL